MEAPCSLKLVHRFDKDYSTFEKVKFKNRKSVDTRLVRNSSPIGWADFTNRFILRPIVVNSRRTIRNSGTDVARFNQRPTAWQLTASSTTFKFRASCSGPDVINVMGIIFLNIPVLQLPHPSIGSRSGDIYKTRIQISCQAGGITRWRNFILVLLDRIVDLSLFFFLFHCERSIINFLVKKRKK